MIEQEIRELVSEAIDAAAREGALGPRPDLLAFDVERPRQREHGDWSANVAMRLAKAYGRPPREIADAIVAHMPAREWVRGVDVAGAGFINFSLSHHWLHDACAGALTEGDRWGSSTSGLGASVNVEFVSINPTGPLHVGSARNAALGDAIARLLEFQGYRVTREYYFNDAGSQMTNFGLSVAARYLEVCGRESQLPEDGYHGTYVVDLAREILAAEGDVHAAVPLHELGEVMRDRAYPIVIRWIQESLERFRVHMDVWSKERDLYEHGEVAEVLDRLTDLGYVYEEGGALWLRSSDLGDSRDRPIVRSFGAKEPTYLVPDLAYHVDKAKRGYALMIIVLGADHHGHAPSLKAGMKALGFDPDRIEVVVYQWVHMLRAGEKLPMSKRAGTFVALDELIDEVGTDAARFTLLSTSADNTLNFDIEDVKKQSLENPVYYVQYAHARICSILRGAASDGIAPTADITWEELHHDAEIELMRHIATLPELAAHAAGARAPHRLTTYAQEVARAFHAFYTQCHVRTKDPALRTARLALSEATRQTLANVLGLLGVSAPERMDRDAEIEGDR